MYRYVNSTTSTTLALLVWPSTESETKLTTVFEMGWGRRAISHERPAEPGELAESFQKSTKNNNHALEMYSAKMTPNMIESCLFNSLWMVVTSADSWRSSDLNCTIVTQKPHSNMKGLFTFFGMKLLDQCCKYIKSTTENISEGWEVMTRYNRVRTR